MKRRDFLKKLPIAMSVPFAIGGIPMKVMAGNQLAQLAGLAGAANNNDRVLIILQMHGGNDGMNCLIPIESYDQYYKKRSNIAIPAKGLRQYIELDSTLASDSQVGLHPDMSAMKHMYELGRLNIIQGVSYENNNGSHFRGRDIMFMGGGSDDYFSSGWLGRYLTDTYQQYGTYPDPFDYDAITGMPDPLALEMGSDVSLIFHQYQNIPASVSINNPKAFNDLVNDLEGFDDTIDNRGFPPDFLKDSPYWNEMDWILKIEDKSKYYAEKLYAEWKVGGPAAASVNYPEKYPFNAPKGSLDNPLTPQLQLIARLLKGGCKTRVFMVKIGGFDTHADQVESYDATMGGHAALMYHISSAMKAFQDDLHARGLEGRVLTVTTSEFGRRLASNGSFGTDHGTAGPIFVFGSYVAPGVIGKAYDVSGDYVNMQFDYRQVYANIMKDWMMVPPEKVNVTIFGDQNAMPVTGRNFIDGQGYSPLPIIDNTVTGTDEFIKTRYRLNSFYPNPATDKTTVSFRVNSTCNVLINLSDVSGRSLKVLVNKTYQPGEHTEVVDLNGIPAGNYVCEMKAAFFKDAKKLVIQK